MQETHSLQKHNVAPFHKISIISNIHSAEKKDCKLPSSLSVNDDTEFTSQRARQTHAWISEGGFMWTQELIQSKTDSKNILIHSRFMELELNQWNPTNKTVQKHKYELPWQLNELFLATDNFNLNK